MREIKFRVWNTDSNEWVSNENKQSETKLNYSSNYLVKWHPYILEQYTGLKDKNGKEIYEGDIIEFHGNYTSIEKCGAGKKGVVTWNLDGMRFDLYVKGLGYYDVSTETDEWHYKRLVIGNIHETK